MPDEAAADSRQGVLRSEAPTVVVSGGEHRAPPPGRFVSAARVFMFLTFISRIFGLVRDSVCAAAFGRGMIWDCFSIGFRVPNLFRRLFGEGALSAALVPTLTDYDASDDPAKRALGPHLVHAVVTLLTMLLAALTVAIELVLLAVWFKWGDSPRARLTIGLTAALLPYVILVCLVGLLSAVLNVRGRFAEGAAAPIILNLCNILAAAVIVPLIPAPDHVRIFVMAGSVMIGGVLQLALIARALRVRGVSLRFRPDWRDPGVRRVAMLVGPMIAPLAVVQINVLVDGLVVWFLTGPDQVYRLGGLTIPRFLENGSVAALEWAAHLYEMPLGVFSAALATAIFPALSRHASRGDLRGLADTLRRGLEIALLIAAPATAGLLLLRTELVQAVLQYRKFTADDTRVVANVMSFFVLGLAAFSAQQLLVRAFYSLKQVRAQVWIAVSMVALNLPLNLALLFAMRSPSGPALSTTICAFIQAFWLGLLLRKRLGPFGGRRIARSLARTLAATAVMVAVLGAVRYGLALTWGDGAGGMLLRWGKLGLLVAVGAAAFYLAARLLRIDALTELLSKES